MGLGSINTYDLDEARELARKARQQLKENIDPLTARMAQTQAAKLAAAKDNTFKECAEDYFNFHKDKWTSGKWQKNFTTTMNLYVYPKVGHLSVASIDTGLVLECIKPIWKTKTHTADHVRRRIADILQWATVHNLRSGENPARWAGHLKHSLPSVDEIAETSHHAALPFAEAPAFMAKLRGTEGIAARALELTVLCALRTKEVIGARWDEIDFATKTWTVPKARMKFGAVMAMTTEAKRVFIYRIRTSGSCRLPQCRSNSMYSGLSGLSKLRLIFRSCATLLQFQ